MTKNREKDERRRMLDKRRAMAFQVLRTNMLGALNAALASGLTIDEIGEEVEDILQGSWDID